MKFCVVLLSIVAATAALPQNSNYQVRLAFNNPAGVTLTGAGYEPTFQIQQFGQQALAQQQQQQPQPAGRQGDADTDVVSVQPEEPAQDQQQQQVVEQQQPEFQPEAQPQPQPEFQPEGQPQQQPEAQPAQVAQDENPQPAPPAYQNYAPPPSIPYQRAYAAGPVAYHTAHAAPVAYHAAHPAQVAYHAAPVAYQAAHPAPVAYHAAPAAYAPAVAVHQKVGYAATPVLTKVQGVADIPVTKLAYTHGVTQKLVDVAHPAVATRKVKVRRPALRQEFYDIEHRVIIRPAGSATLELSQPISKEQRGPAVLTPTKFVHTAPVVRYGLSRQIVDGQVVAAVGRSATPVEGTAAPEARNASPSPAASPAPRAGPSQPAPTAQEPAQPEARAQPAPQGQEPQARSADTEVVEAQPQEQQQQDQPQQAAPQQAQPGLITPNMPLELQQRLLQLLSGRGGTVTEVLGEDGKPADSASVLQVAEALGDPSLQGGERITTRRIVVTRPIETIQDVEVQEPATKFQRLAVQQPTLFKTAIPAVARVPVAVPAVKHYATPVVKTYAQPAYAAYQHQHYVH